MGAKVLQEGAVFFGQTRKAGSFLTDDELAKMTDQTKSALVGQKILEIEGYAAPGATVGGVTMSAADKEALGSMSARLDAMREQHGKDMTALHDKLDAILAASGGKVKKARKARK